MDPTTAAHSPWLAESVCDEHLLAELAADLGGGTPAEPQRQYSVVGQTAPQFSGMPPLGMMQPQSSLPQPLMFPMGLGLGDAQQALLAFGSAPDILPNSLTSANNGSYGANGMLQNQAQPMLMFRPAFLGAGGGGGPSKSHSPSTSSGAVQAGDELTELCDQRGAGRAVNKGALAQKRFRERQKVRGRSREGASGVSVCGCACMAACNVQAYITPCCQQLHRPAHHSCRHPAPALPCTQEKMRANEAQVAELTRRLNEVELDRSRLASRARLLEQVRRPHGVCLWGLLCSGSLLSPSG